jgi:hypothetical protein
MRRAHRILVGKPEGKISRGRPTSKWEDNIKMDINDTGYEDAHLIHLAQDRIQLRDLVKAGSIKVEEFIE